MKKTLIILLLGLISATFSTVEIIAQDDTFNDVKIDAPVSGCYQNTDWILLGETKAYKAVENQCKGELYVRFIAGKFFYKFIQNGESYVVNPFLSKSYKNMEFQEIITNSNAMVNLKNGRYYLAVPTW